MQRLQTHAQVHTRRYTQLHLPERNWLLLKLHFGSEKLEPVTHLPAYNSSYNEPCSSGFKTAFLEQFHTWASPTLGNALLPLMGCFSLLTFTADVFKTPWCHLITDLGKKAESFITTSLRCQLSRWSHKLCHIAQAETPVRGKGGLERGIQ